MSIFHKSAQHIPICPIVAIVGVDGCGKSTVIEQMKSYTSDFPTVIGITFAHVVHPKRPRHPIVNHNLPPRHTLVAAAKLIERALRWRHKYYTEFLYQQKKGTLLLCDRFYFDDIMIDPLKYRYAGPAWFLELLRKIVPGPQIYILLDLPEIVAFKRKQETALEEITVQRERFLRLVNSKPNGYVLDANQPLDIVVESIRNILVAARDNHNGRQIHK